MEPSKKKKRELEIAANFEKVLNHLPVDFYNSFINALLEYEIPPEKKVNKLESKREIAIFDGQKRADLVLNSNPGFSNIVFEFKLNDENLAQVEDYAKHSSDYLVVSLAKILSGQVCNINNVRRLTWNNLFNGLLKIASSEIRNKLIPLDKTETFSPGFPDRRLGEPALSFLEDFLFTVKEQKLVPFKGERVLVVTGDLATRTTKKYKVYWFGNHWDKDFQYLIVVSGSTIQFIGKVEERYFGYTDLDDIPHKSHKELIKNVFKEEKDRDTFKDHPIILLESIKEEMIGKKYIGKGPITQSHRYFENLDQAFKEFINK